MLTLLLQEGAENLPSLAAEEEPVEKTLSLFDLLMSGGLPGQIIILVLFVLLFVAIYIYFERLFAIKAASGMDSNFMNQIKDNVANGKIEAAKVLCAQQNSPVSRLTAKGISAAPMIGFLGTVIGMVLAFHQLATSSGQAEMGNLAEGIYTAMTTTVAGLIVGIIAYIGYNHLVVRTDKVVHQMEATAVDFLDMLNEPV